MSRNLDWMESASCRDHPNPDLFFPSISGNGAQKQIAEARRICSACPVQEECGEQRVTTGATHGVWGAAVVAESYGKSSGGPQHSAALHGSDAGYRQHLRRGEKPCQACRSAHSRKWAPNGRSKCTGFGGR